MIRRKPLLVAIAAIVAGATAFTMTLSARAQRSPDPAGSEKVLLDWLGVDASQRQALIDHDPSFDQDLSQLRGTLDNARKELAKALDDATTSNDRLRACSEANIAANAAVERRVMDHLLALRDHLTPAQQRQLFSLCAEGVRQGHAWRWRRGQDNPSTGTNQGRGPAWARDRENGDSPRGR